MPPRYSMSFSDFLDHDAALKGSGEHVAVTQSPSRDLSELNLPSLPPHLESLVGPTLNARNFWAASAPKVSVLHYDWQDSVLLQLSGRKRFTIIDPARMQAAYPAVMKQERLVRDAPGKYSRVGTPVEIDNFPLVNLTHPDLERHPLFNDAQMMTVELAPGDALLLPAAWYHQVESFSDDDGLCIAVNYWFQGNSLATRLYRTVRENLFINCSIPKRAGILHPCRQ